MIYVNLPDWLYLLILLYLLLSITGHTLELYRRWLEWRRKKARGDW